MCTKSVAPGYPRLHRLEQRRGRAGCRTFFNGTTRSTCVPDETRAGWVAGHHLGSCASFATSGARRWCFHVPEFEIADTEFRVVSSRHRLGNREAPPSSRIRWPLSKRVREVGLAYRGQALRLTAVCRGNAVRLVRAGAGRSRPTPPRPPPAPGRLLSSRGAGSEVRGVNENIIRRARLCIAVSVGSRRSRTYGAAPLLDSAPQAVRSSYRMRRPI
jgi:hypothetical protein